jgi:hypothetical protein
MVDKIKKNINNYSALIEPANSDRSTIRRITIGYKVFERTLYPAVILFVFCDLHRTKPQKNHPAKVVKRISNQLNTYIVPTFIKVVKLYVDIKLLFTNLTDKTVS